MGIFGIIKRFWFGSPPAKKPLVLDCRNWNENWQVGDIAECVARPEDWSLEVPPWERPKKGQQFIVEDFDDALCEGGHKRCYFLKLRDWPSWLETIAFRKIQPVATEKSEIAKRILEAKPGVDRVREPAELF